MVKCADCGFLAVRNVSTRELEEAESQFREHGDIPDSEVEPGLGRHQGIPLCFAGVNLRNEITVEMANWNPGREDIVTVMQRERCCDYWTEWQLGFTPKEHRETFLEEQKRRYEEEARERERRFQEEMINRQIETIKESARNARLFVLIGAFLGALIPIAYQVSTKLADRLIAP